MAWLLLPMRVGNQSITSAIPHGNNRSVRIKEGTASDSELRVSLRVAHGLAPKEQRAKGKGKRAKGKGQRAKGKGQRAKGKVRRAFALLPFCPYLFALRPSLLVIPVDAETPRHTIKRPTINP